MSNFCDYTTIQKVRQLYIGTDAPTRDDTLLMMIQETARDIEHFANRQFYPITQTRTYDAPHFGYGWAFSGKPNSILLDDDLLGDETVTNGDATVLVKGTDYLLYPLNDTPYNEIRLLPGSGTLWRPDTHGNFYGVVTVAGSWGYHPTYSSAWVDTLATASAIGTTSTTSVTATTGKVYAGDLIKIDTEQMYVISVATGASDTLTVRRGVNGSTAATHSASAVINRWTYEAIEGIVRTGVVAYWRTRNNPAGENIIIDGNTFSTPRDVQQWINKRMMGLGLIRTGVG